MPSSSPAGNRRRGGRSPINTPAEARSYLVREFGERAVEVLTDDGSRYARFVRELIAAVPVLDALRRFTGSLQDVRPIHGIDVPSGDRPPEAGRVTLGSLVAAAQAIYNAVTALNREIRRFYENPVTVEAVRKIVDKPWLLSCGGAIAHLHHELPAAREFLPKDLEALGVVLGLDSDPRVDANHDKWRKRLPEVREAAAALDRSLFPSSGQNDFDPPDLTGLLRS